MPDRVTATARVVNEYLDGRLELEQAARLLLAAWEDPASGGWGLFLDDKAFAPQALVRARALEARFNELVADAVSGGGRGTA